MAARYWGSSKDGFNQGLIHFFDYGRKWPQRIVNIAEKLGIDPSDFKLTNQGFKKFTNSALNIINNIDELGGQVRYLGKSKLAYYYNGVIVIWSQGKIQTMFTGTLKWFVNNLK